MNPSMHSQIRLYKQIESICLRHTALWNQIPEFRGAFSRFALKVGQLDLLLENQSNTESHLSHLLTEIERILGNRFDRFFDFLKNKHQALYEDYLLLRRK